MDHFPEVRMARLGRLAMAVTPVESRSLVVLPSFELVEILKYYVALHYTTRSFNSHRDKHEFIAI